MSRRKEKLEASLEGLFSKAKRRLGVPEETPQVEKEQSVTPPPPQKQETPLTIAKEPPAAATRAKPLQRKAAPLEPPAVIAPTEVAVERVEVPTPAVSVTPAPVSAPQESIAPSRVEAEEGRIVLATGVEVERRPVEEVAESQIVVFLVNENYYGVDVSSVQTIIKPQPICPVPHTPAYLLGLTNLRGQVVPVIDLRMRLGYPPIESTKDTRIIIVEIEKEWAGIMVDAVSGVLSLSREAIESASEILSKTDISLLSGVAKSDGKLILLLDVVRVFLLGIRETRGGL